MKKILTIFLILLISQVCFAGRLQEMQKAVIAAKNGAASCPADGSYDDRSNDTASTFYGLSPNADWYAVGSHYTPAANVDICKIGVKVTKDAGDISGENYRVKIYTLSGTNADTLLGTSNEITGSNAWSAAWVRFPFASAVSLTASTEYLVVIENAGGLETTNTLSVHSEESISSTLFYMYTFNNLGISVGAWANRTVSIEVYFND